MRVEGGGHSITDHTSAHYTSAHHTSHLPVRSRVAYAAKEEKGDAEAAGGDAVVETIIVMSEFHIMDGRCPT